MLSDFFSDPFALFVAITLVIAGAHLLTAYSRFAEQIGVTILVITAAMVLGNLNIVPHDESAYSVMPKYFVPLSIALLLFRLDLRELKKLKPLHLYFFLFGSFASIVGGVVAWALFRSRIGVDTAHLTGQLVASYIGGGENAVAVAKAVGVPHNLFTAAFAADNVVTTIWLLIGLSAPYGLARFFSKELSSAQTAPKELTHTFTDASFIPSAAYSLGAAAIIVLVSGWIAVPIREFAELHNIEFLRFNTSIIWITTFALLLAQTRLRHHMNTAYPLGLLLLYYFFFYMGAISSVQEIAKIGPVVFLFVSTIVGVHAVIVLGVGKLLKIDVATIFICSQANIGGPSTALALAEANGWHHMVTPGILLGILGYAIANYFGLALAQMLW